MNSLQEKIGWSDNKLLLSAKPNISIDPIEIKTKSYIQKIADYVESQIKEFLEDNKISERQWLKRGVIQRLPQELGGQSYVFYYKNWRMEVRRKVTINYNFVTNPEELTIKNCERKHYIAENPHSEISAAIPCYTQGCKNCIYKSN